MSVLSCYADSVISSLGTEPRATPLFCIVASESNQTTVTEHSLLNLQSVLPRNLVLAALDLIDRGNGRYPPVAAASPAVNECVLPLVLKCIGPVRHHYEVLGSTATYRVFLNIPGPISAYCTCPAFAYLVLSSESYLMCKHVLAARLGNQLARCIDRPVNGDEITSMILQEYS
ncbi:hypothetical protein C8R44DRAFT_889682 [Mycena epipterygia]|nr:hypothetical protein C8R44DRAFT_889682 [Mycena epipterygia]